MLKLYKSLQRKKGKQNGRRKLEKEIGEAIADTAENKEDREKQRGIEIVDMLAAEGVTYSEAYSILKSADYELSRRQYSETKDKRVTTNK